MAKFRNAFNSLFKLIKLVIALAILFGLFFYISNYHKDELNKFYLKFDVWGVTDIGRTELQRLEAIDDLEKEVVHVQREALKNRTVFLGATDKMVILALGKPLKDPKLNSLNQQVWIYNFDDYSRPTYLYFEKRSNKWILVKAEKISN